MIFTSEQQRDFYTTHKNIVDKGHDYAALIYTLGINDDCRRNFSRLYDEKENCIIADGLWDGWQTSGSRSITRLAFNLFTWKITNDDDPVKYTPKNIFDGLDDEQRYGALKAIELFA